MTLKLVPAVKTVYSKGEIAKALVIGWKQQFGDVPKKQAIGVLYSQIAIETGFKAMWNNNIGNVKVPSKLEETIDFDYMMLASTWEIINGKKVYFQPPHRQTWFRSFRTLNEGVAHHLYFLKNGRYKAVWGSIERGSIVDFATTLKNRGYYTASVSDYIKGMNLYYNEFMKSKVYEQALDEINNIKPVVIAPVVDVVEVPKETFPTADIVTDDLITESKKYIQVSKKLNKNWYDGIVEFFQKMFKSFNKN